jgi:hypothetical protein
MYYLFIHKKSELQKYKSEFDRVLKAIEEGKTPVQNELRTANTVLFESFPYQTLSGIFLVIGSFILDKLRINSLAKIAVVLVINNMCYAISNYIFTYIKHFLRIKLCKRLGIESTERNIAVMESMEYQSV